MIFACFFLVIRIFLRHEGICFLVNFIGSLLQKSTLVAICKVFQKLREHFKNILPELLKS